MRDDNSKLVRACDLTIGMHVCELDRPWMELPFEPPFQLQGFRIESADDIEKIRQHCSHVYVDMGPSARKHRATDQKKIRSRFSVYPMGLLRRLQNSLKSGAKESRHRANASISHSITPPAGSSDPAGRGKIYDFEKLNLTESYFRALPHKYIALAPNAPKRIVYHNQTTLDEEFEPAKRALDNVNNFYSDLINELDKDKKFDYPKLRDGVNIIARSIIRNPDALCYLVYMKSFNKQTYNLAISSSVMAMAFGRFLGLSDTEIEDLGTGALLQDVGMIQVPPEILNKQDALTQTEFKIVKRHVALTKRIIEKMPGISRDVVGLCFCHHERFDGLGYPRGLKQNQIPLFSMITGIVDTYLALISYRPYRREMTSYEALCELAEMKNKQFLGALVERFIQNIAIFPVGSFVQLNSGHVGIIVARNPMRYLEPKVMLILDPAGKPLDQALTINFASEQRSRFFEGLKISREVVPKEFGIDAKEFFS